MRARTTKGFYKVVTAAVAHFAEHGYSERSDLEEWLDRIRRAAERDMIPERELQAKLNDQLRAAYHRMVEEGALLRNHPDIASRFTLQRVKPKLRAELDRRILASANLIRLNRAEAIETTLRRFSGWATSIPPGGSVAVDRNPVKAEVRKRLTSLPFRERRVAIDQGHKFVANLSEILAVDGGALAGTWHQHHTRYPREVHTDRDGKTYAVRWNWAIERGLMNKGEGYTDEIERPGELVFCFPGSTHIPFADRVEVAYRRWYDGELTEIVTDSGKTLRATPNHPILTSNGWIAIGKIQEGDYVVEIADDGIGIFPYKTDEYDTIPLISEVFSTIKILGVVEACNGRRGDFHGDGTDGYVDVVRATRPLRFGVKALKGKDIEHVGLSDPYNPSLARCFIGKFFGGHFSTACGVVRRSYHAFTLFCRSVGPSIKHLITSDMPHSRVGISSKFLTLFDRCLGITCVSCFGSVPYPNAGISQSRIDHAYANVDFLRYFWGTFTRIVGGDDACRIDYPAHAPSIFEPRHSVKIPVANVRRIERTVTDVEQCGDLDERFPFKTKRVHVIKVNREPYIGHVYNLQTEEGWYLADGIVSHNCRCTYSYIYSLGRLPPSMITQKGRDELARVRTETRAA